MTRTNDSTQAIVALARRVRDLEQQAEREYRPVVEAILRTDSPDVGHIERTLDGLLDFCGHEPVLELYKQLCRKYWVIDPAATADYIQAYRERWADEDDGCRRPPARQRGRLPAVTRTCRGRERL